MFCLDYGAIVSTMLFMGAYSWTTGPIAWVYATETLIDTGLGVTMLAMNVSIFVLSLISPVLMDSD